ncbi:hypothetical protein AX15_005159 [Amanita polypyramis BW_CC]|nr:hypothetical protein AX15_005159 [Amanita polypyramis BW_CC]
MLPTSTPTITPTPPPPPTLLKAYDDMPFHEPTTEGRFSHKTEPSLSTSIGTRYSRTESVGGPSYEDILLRTGMDRSSHIHTQTQPQSEPNAADVAAVTATATPVDDSLPTPVVSPSPAQRKLRKFFRPTGWRYSKPKVYVTRRPPSGAVLLPENRYCSRDGIAKPYRTHHCRHCGTCILKYDHHCPWIGQCVGARNHKFFVNFIGAACIFCIYVFATVLAFTVIDTVDNKLNVDPQLVIIIVLAGIFGLFTSALTFSHVWLILNNQTTVESMGIRRMKERESAQLDKAFSVLDCRSKKHMREEWDREWGNLEYEGHIWWTGDKRAAWEDVMGRNVLGWFFPVSRGLNNGLSYPVNPRFGPDGRWRRRSEWPAEFQ